MKEKRTIRRDRARYDAMTEGNDEGFADVPDALPEAFTGLRLPTDSAEARDRYISDDDQELGPLDEGRGGPATR
jgi:hypothetical protein